MFVCVNVNVKLCDDDMEYDISTCERNIEISDCYLRL